MTSPLSTRLMASHTPITRFAQALGLPSHLALALTQADRPEDFLSAQQIKQVIKICEEHPARPSRKEGVRLTQAVIHTLEDHGAMTTVEILDRLQEEYPEKELSRIKIYNSLDKLRKKRVVVSIAMPPTPEYNNPPVLWQLTSPSINS